MSQKEVFSEQQVTEIIRRATQLNESSTQSEGYTPGVTRAELEKIATEIGVDPGCLEQAILESKMASGRRRGLRLSEECERVVDGELDPDNYDLILEFARTFGRMGPGISQVGRSVRARAFAGGSPASITITSRNGRTKVNVRSSPVFALIAGGYPAVMGSLIASAPLFEAHQYLAGFGTIGGFLALGAAIGIGLIRAGQNATRKLADRVRDRVQEEIDAKAQEAPPIRQQVEETQEVRQP